MNCLLTSNDILRHPGIGVYVHIPGKERKNDYINQQQTENPAYSIYTKTQTNLK